MEDAEDKDLWEWAGDLHSGNNYAEPTGTVMVGAIYLDADPTKTYALGV